MFWLPRPPYKFYNMRGGGMDDVIWDIHFKFTVALSSHEKSRAWSTSRSAASAGFSQLQIDLTISALERTSQTPSVNINWKN